MNDERLDFIEVTQYDSTSHGAAAAAAFDEALELIDTAIKNNNNKKTTTTDTTKTQTETPVVKGDIGR